MSERKQFVFPKGEMGSISFLLPFSEMISLPANPSEEVAQVYIDAHLIPPGHKDAIRSLPQCLANPLSEA